MSNSFLDFNVLTNCFQGRNKMTTRLPTSWFINSIAGLTICLFLLYKYTSRKYTYWEKKNIFGPKPLPIFGNTFHILTAKYSLGTLLETVYKRYEDPFIGLYTFDDPALLIRSPEIAKQILVKDFSYFYDRTFAAPQHNDVISSVQFFQKNPEWMKNRKQISPIYSPMKIKNMFEDINNISVTMINYLKANDIQDVGNLCLKYAAEVTTKSFFGIHAKFFDKEETEIMRRCKELLSCSLRNIVVQNIYSFKPIVVDLFGLNFISISIQIFFQKVVRHSLKSIEDLKISSNNFIGSLCRIRQMDPSFDGGKILAQGLTAYLGGAVTNSSAIAFTLFELSMNKKIQEKLRKEIEETLNEHEEMNYDCLKNMKYMDMCLMETLRKYPILNFLDRRCMADYQVPGTDLLIEKGTAVYISLRGIQNDPQYFPEPEKYIPERFGYNNVENMIYMPFGSGPRMCVGKRFAMITIKIALVQILKNFELEKLPTTPNEIKFDSSFTLNAKYPLELRFRSISVK